MAWFNKLILERSPDILLLLLLTIKELLSWQRLPLLVSVLVVHLVRSSAQLASFSFNWVAPHHLDDDHRDDVQHS